MQESPEFCRCPLDVVKIRWRFEYAPPVHFRGALPRLLLIRVLLVAGEGISLESRSPTEESIWDNSHRPRRPGLMEDDVPLPTRGFSESILVLQKISSEMTHSNFLAARKDVHCRSCSICLFGRVHYKQLANSVLDSRILSTTFKLFHCGSNKQAERPIKGASKRNKGSFLFSS